MDHRTYHIIIRVNPFFFSQPPATQFYCLGLQTLLYIDKSTKL
jgi:hypothetical protein